MEGKLTTGPINSQTDISTGRYSGLEWRRVVCSVVNGAGDSVDPVTGTLKMQVQITGSDKWLDAATDLALFDGDRWYDPFYDAVEAFRFTPQDLPADTFVDITVHAWEG